MKVFKYDTMIKGWFVGNITPTAFKTNDCEVAWKTYKAGEKHGKHYHKIATEITYFVYGKARMNGELYGAGDILVIETNEVTDFECLEDCGTVVVKVPGANNDKYEVD
jgi:quercetin dioxygenase-like cupin family protein